MVNGDRATNGDVASGGTLLGLGGKGRALDTKNAEAELGLKPGILPIWRVQKRQPQPKYHKVGRRVVYYENDLLEYLKQVESGV